MLPPMFTVIPLWRHLDEWDALIFVAGLAVGAGGLVALGAESAQMVGSLAVVAGVLAVQVRRVVNPGLAAREAGPPPPPLTVLEMLLLAFGIFGALVTAGAGVIALSMAFGGPQDQRPPIEVRLGATAFVIASAAGSTGLIHLARRLRRRRAT